MSTSTHRPRHARIHRIAACTVLGLAPLALLACEPAPTVDASQVRPAGSAPTEEPGHTVKFDSNNASGAPKNEAPK